MDMTQITPEMMNQMLSQLINSAVTSAPKQEAPAPKKKETVLVPEEIMTRLCDTLGLLYLFLEHPHEANTLNVHDIPDEILQNSLVGGAQIAYDLMEAFSDAHPDKEVMVDMSNKGLKHLVPDSKPAQPKTQERVAEAKRTASAPVTEQLDETAKNILKTLFGEDAEWHEWTPGMKI